MSVVGSVDAVGDTAEVQGAAVRQRQRDRVGGRRRPKGSSTRSGRDRLSAPVVIVDRAGTRRASRAGRLGDPPMQRTAGAAARFERAEHLVDDGVQPGVVARSDHGSSGSGGPCSMASPKKRSSTACTPDPRSSALRSTTRSGSSRSRRPKHVGQEVAVAAMGPALEACRRQRAVGGRRDGLAGEVPVPLGERRRPAGAAGPRTRVRRGWRRECSVTSPPPLDEAGERTPGRARRATPCTGACRPRAIRRNGVDDRRAEVGEVGRVHAVAGDARSPSRAAIATAAARRFPRRSPRAKVRTRASAGALASAARKVAVLLVDAAPRAAGARRAPGSRARVRQHGVVAASGRAESLGAAQHEHGVEVVARRCRPSGPYTTPSPNRPARPGETSSSAVRARTNTSWLGVGLELAERATAGRGRPRPVRTPPARTRANCCAGGRRRATGGAAPTPRRPWPCQPVRPLDRGRPPSDSASTKLAEQHDLRDVAIDALAQRAASSSATASSAALVQVRAQALRACDASRSRSCTTPARRERSSHAAGRAEPSPARSGPPLTSAMTLSRRHRCAGRPRASSNVRPADRVGQTAA